MADTKTTTPTPAAPAVPTLDWKLAESQLTEVKRRLFSDDYNGKPGFNPHLYWNRNGYAELEKRFNSGERTPGLHTGLLGIKFAEPTVPKKLTLPE